MQVKLTKDGRLVRQALGLAPPRDWEELVDTLLRGSNSRVDDASIRRSASIARLPPAQRFRGLRAAIDKFSKFVAAEDFNFYRDLLPFIWRWALDFDAAETNSPVYLLRPAPPLAGPADASASGTRLSSTNDDQPALADEPVRTNELSRRFIRHVLANAFFLLDGWTEMVNFGRISFDAVFAGPTKLGVERVLCQLSYFYQWMLECEKVVSDRLDENELVVFQRLRLVDSLQTNGRLEDPADPSKVQTVWLAPRWEQMDEVFNGSEVHIHENDMESTTARVFVDFANR